jgi:Right handed beta helix region
MNTNAKHRRRVILLCGLILGTLWETQAVDLYVATNGSDSWSGAFQNPNAEKTDGPFAGLERARDAIRKLRALGGLPQESVRVTVRGGLYPLEKAFQLTAEDSGMAEAPVIYRAFPGEEVRFLGGKVVRGFKPVIDPTILSRLDESARAKVVQADLRALGISEFGDPGGGGLELFFADKPMRLSRWPNDGFARIVDVLGKTPVDVRGTKGCVEGLFTFDSDRPKRWADEKDPWVHGYWFWDWSDQRQRVKAIDLAQRTIEIAPPYHGYGYRKGQWYYAYNLLSEIDQPGEWYLDRDTGVLYFWPPDSLETGQAIVSVLPTLLLMENTSHVTLRGFIFEAARSTALIISGGTGNRIIGCTIRNVGGSAVSISGGSSHGIVGCDIYQCGAGGVSLSGGDRKTLTAASHYADNNHIHDYGRWQPMYSAGLSLSGVGLRATHNLIDNAPHQAISFGGNDHLIEFNEIHSVCYESNDAGAIYAGRDWTMRGTIIRHNYLHDITGFEGRGCVGVYLDDMFCGTEIIGNVFYRVTRAAFIGGGRDCRIENNIFVDCRPAVHVDARALGWAKYHADDWVKEGHEKGTLSGIHYQKPPYSVRYPSLMDILSEEPEAPKGNVITCNICVGGRWEEIESNARPFISIHDNLLTEDPHFVNAPNQDFRIKGDSPAYQFGFKQLPIGRIGLYQDNSRASWPVKSDVRSIKPSAAR